MRRYIYWAITWMDDMGLKVMPEDRFDAMWARYLGQTFSLEDEAREWLKRNFCKAMEESQREAVEEDRANRCADDLYKGCYQRGLEDAAKIIENTFWAEGYNPKELLINQIRARAKELTNDE